jgi:hypothetical protein
MSIIYVMPGKAAWTARMIEKIIRNIFLSIPIPIPIPTPNMEIFVNFVTAFASFVVDLPDNDKLPSPRLGPSHKATAHFVGAKADQDNDNNSVMRGDIALIGLTLYCRPFAVKVLRAAVHWCWIRPSGPGFPDSRNSTVP